MIWAIGAEDVINSSKKIPAFVLMVVITGNMRVVGNATDATPGARMRSIAPFVDLTPLMLPLMLSTKPKTKRNRLKNTMKKENTAGAMHGRVMLVNTDCASKTKNRIVVILVAILTTMDTRAAMAIFIVIVANLRVEIILINGVSL
jgi:hypothetical protein